MMPDLPKKKDIFREDNMLLLTKNILFQDTTRIEGARTVASIREGEQRFHGYVYIAARWGLPVPNVFNNGIHPVHYECDTGLRIMFYKDTAQYDVGIPLTDLSARANLNGGIITYTCYLQACYSDHTASEVYLIDARELGGIIRTKPPPRYNNKGTLFSTGDKPALPYMHAYDSVFFSSCATGRIYDVVIMHPISNSRIVGVIKGHPLSSSLSFRPQALSQLKLYVNAEYAGGMDSARKVVESFNGGREWEIV